MRRATSGCGQYCIRVQISIHALLAESDNILCVVSIQVGGFLSTLSLRRATRRSVKLFRQNYISIHALLAESDSKSLFTSVVSSTDFYPRSPCGERLFALLTVLNRLLFLSTLSLRRATRKLPIRLPTALHFYPRSPCGERLAGPSGPAFLYNFYPRSPCGERHFRSSIKRAICNFYPRSPCGERPRKPSIQVQHLPFLSTLSLRRATRQNQNL